MSTIAERLTAALADRYRIERELGQGGMATVYLAEDLKHDRKVALKVLKPELAAVLGAERFVVEIKTTAALQHPNILPLFDSGTADGFLFYVMPFIQGETLRDKLNRETQLAVDEAVRITADVADALHYAHEQGVIHRDIKPENILLANGRPMVADFGIALAVSAAAGGRMTETGLSLGTPHYMSPEQATAEKTITARSDVYSLASVLYETLTGEPPHTGASAQAIIMKIIAEPVQPVTELRRSVPPNVACAVAKALEKLPADRFASARAFAEALANPAFRTEAVSAAAASATTAVRIFGRAWSWRAVTAAMAIVSVSAIVWTMTRERGARDGIPVMRAELAILSQSDSGVVLSGVDISPDGQMIVYGARPSGEDSPPSLLLRRLDDRTARLIPGTEGAGEPAFSPDGQSLAFVFKDNSIRRMPVAGGAAETVLNAGDNAELSDLRWASDGHLYFVNSRDLTRVPERGGSPTVVASKDFLLSPELLPDGRHLLYTECCDETSEAQVLDLTTGKVRSLGVRALRVRYMPSGHLLLVTGDALRAVAFDVRTLEVHGEPIAVLDSATTNGTISRFALSRTGTAVYTVRPQRPSPVLQLTLVDLAGNERRLPLPGAWAFSGVRFSPDGRRIAFTIWDSTSLFVHDLVLGSTTQREVGGVSDPLWMVGGARVAYGSFSEGDSVALVASVNADGTGAPDTLLKAGPGDPSPGDPMAFSPDGKQLLLGSSRNGNGDLQVSRFQDGWGAPSQYLGADWDERDGAISPDGRWVAYASDEERSPGSGRERVYVRSFPEPGARFVVSGGAGSNPRWAPDGRTIYYWRDDHMVVAASVRTTPDFAVTGRRDLFTKSGATGSYDLHPDGKQFIMAIYPPPPVEGAGTPRYEPPRLVVVVNWLEEFKRKIGAR